MFLLLILSVKCCFLTLPFLAISRARKTRGCDTVSTDTYVQHNPVPRSLDGVAGFCPRHSCESRDDCKKTSFFFLAVEALDMLALDSELPSTSVRVIYLLLSPCGLQCVDETVPPVQTGIIEHKSTIRSEDISSCVAHQVHQAAHSVSTL